MKNIIRFFATEHLFGNLLTILFIVLGLYTISSIRRDIWPEVDFGITTIRGALGGASPEQVEKLIINPMESALRGVDGLKKVSSTSTESTGVIVLNLDKDARDKDKTNDDIRRSIDQVDDFPEEAIKPIVTEIDSTVYPVIEVTVGGNLPAMEIRKAADFMADELERLPLVARVSRMGYLKREYLIEADPEKLAARQVSLGSLITTIKLRNISLPGGTASDNTGLERLVKTEAEYENPNEIMKTVVFANDAGFGTRIGDVATVQESLEKPDRIYRTNGKDSINLIVMKKANADALTVVESIKDKVKELSTRMPDGIDLGYTNDFSIYLSKRLDALGSNLVVGLILVVIVLALFLPWQATIVVAAGIPVALFGALTAAYLLGYSLNLISLIGLIIVLGMLVDDAIVVTENIWRHMEMGKDIVRATVSGASEVFTPVIASILTTVSAFGPMLFMTGVFGAFIFEIPSMVILALIFSLLEAFLIMPSHFNSWVGPFISSKDVQKNSEKPHWFDRVIESYRNYVRWSLRFRYLMLALVVGFFLITAAVVVKTGRFVLFPPEGIEIFFVTAEAPTGVSLEKMSDLIKPIEAGIIEHIPESERKDFVTTIGLIQQDQNDPLTRRGSHFAQIRISLTPQAERVRTAQQIVEDIREKISKPEGINIINFSYARQGPPQGRPITINLLGENIDTLREIAEKVKSRLGEIDGVIDVQDSYLAGKKEWQVKPRYEDTAEVGLNAQQVAQSVRAAFEGIVASSVRNLEEEIDLRVRLKKSDGDMLHQLENLKIGNAQGNLVNLASVADFVPVETNSNIRHLDYDRVLTVSAEVDLEKVTAIKATNDTKPFITELVSKYPGYSVNYGGEDEDTKESFASLGRAFGFAAFFIFILLVVTFKNLIQPVLILSSIPLGFMGVVYAMAIHGRPLSFMAMLGVIALAGVIVNNAIVFTDFVNRVRRVHNKSLSRSIEEAAAIRLRPIVLTTLTTVCGLLPTAYGDFLRDTFGFGGGDPFIVPIALALGWGLAFGSVMTGLFFPAFIRITDDIRRFI